MSGKDIIARFIELAAASCSTFSEDVALSIEQQLRQEYGGTGVHYIAKTRPKSAEVKREAVQEAARSGRVREAGDKRGISRATMYRMMKQR